MAQMTAEDVRGMSDDELSTKLTELKREQFNLRFQQASGQLEKTGRVREVRRDVARVLTLMNQRRTEKEAKAAPASDAAATQTQETEVTADA